jgi:tetratricopeptide (TPR) repeat protein/CHAT domain-containing protein
MIANHDLTGPDPETERVERLATEYYRRARYDEAESLFGQVLDQRRRAQVLDHSKVATALNNLGLVHKVQGHFREAEELYEQALAIRERALGPDHPEVATSLNNLGELYRAWGRHEYAEPIFQRALAISERAFGPGHADVAHSLNGLALLYYTRGEFAKAERLYRRALIILQKTRGPDHADVALLLTNMAELERARGRYGEAEQLSRDALAIWEKALGSDHPHLGSGLEILAGLLQDQGHYDQAEGAFQRALGILEAAYGPDHPEIAGTLSNLGALYRVRGRYREAESLCQRALKIVGTVPARDPALLAVILNNLARVYRSQGRYHEAEPLYRRAVDMQETVHGPDLRELATMLNNLAGLFWAQERYADAEPLYRRALTILERVLGADHPDAASSMNNLAALYAAQERNEEAAPLYRRALQILEKTLHPDHPQVAQVLHNLASLYRREGRYGEAELLYRRALAIRERTLGPDHPEVAATLHNLAFLCDSHEEWHTEALALVRRASAIGRRRAALGRQPRASGVSAEQAGLSSRYRFHLRVLARAVDEGKITPNEGADEGFELAQLALRSRTERAIARMAARFAAREGALAGLAREREDALDRWEVAEEALMQVISKATGEGPLETEARLRTDIARAEADVVRLDAVLADRFPEYTDLISPEPLDLARAQVLLGADEALVVYLAGEESSHVLVVRRHEARLSGLGPSGQALADSIAALRRGLDPCRGGLPPRNRATDARRHLATEPGSGAKARHFDVKRAHQLYLEIWAPIEPFLAGARRVFVVPDKALESLPFHVLVTRPPPAEIAPPEGLRGVEWLAKRDYALAVLPSAGALRGLRQLATKANRGQGLIGFGDPVLGGNWSPDLPAVSLNWRGLVTDVEGLRSLTPLPESAGELEQLAQSLREPRTALFLGPRATERQVRVLNTSKDLAKARVLAFATHGVMAGELNGFNEPGLVLTPPEQPSEEDDGYLAASEIAELDLNTDWVLLSACNTAAADGTPGAEGFSGLARAFFYAGARALLVSHWSVNSEAAVELTTGAFGHLREDSSIGRAEALRRSMVDLIDHGPDPSPAYWAPFIIVGEANV